MTTSGDQPVPHTYPPPTMVAQDDQATREPTRPDDEHTRTGAHSPTSQNRNSTGSRVLGMTGPSGEAGLPPSRPSSIATAQSGSNRRWSQANPSRRGGGMLPSAGGTSVAGSLGAQSRPTTAASRTHVPLAAHGFFRPMSSQRLQQQRNQRPTSLLGHSSLYSEGTSEMGGNPYRQSIGSNQTMRTQHPLGLHHDSEQQPPPSRGTDITDRDLPDRTTANSTPTGAETVRSRGESITPLHRPKPQHLDLSKSLKNDSTKLPTPSRSPRSFSASFGLSGSRDGRPSQMRPQTGHEKLASAESSPRMSRKEPTKETVKNELGKNYQYFSGNTAFCWGGRLQNTRDRPVNIATGTFIVVPSALFLGFSCVSSYPSTIRNTNNSVVHHGYGFMFPLRYPSSLLICFWSVFHHSSMLQLPILG